MRGSRFMVQNVFIEGDISMIKDDKLIIGGHQFGSRFILGSGKYNVELVKAAVEYAGAEIIRFRGAAAKNCAEGLQVTGKCGVTVSADIFIIVLSYKSDHFHAHTPSMLICRALTSSLMVCQLSFSVILVKWV
jgi:hypothetical protein